MAARNRRSASARAEARQFFLALALLQHCAGVGPNPLLDVAKSVMLDAAAVLGDGTDLRSLLAPRSAARGFINVVLNVKP